MRSFKSFITEGTLSPITTRNGVSNWVQLSCTNMSGAPMKASNITVNEDLTVDISDDCFLYDTEIHVKFNVIHGDFTVEGVHDSWDFLPTECQKLGFKSNQLSTLPTEIASMTINGVESRGNPLSSFDNIPPNVSYVQLRGTTITSLVGIQDELQFETLYEGFGTPIELDWAQITEGGLGILLIPGIDSGSHAGSLFADNQQKGKLPEPFEIINRHMATKDVFACQQELIEKGYEAYAQL